MVEEESQKKIFFINERFIRFHQPNRNEDWVGWQYGSNINGYLLFMLLLWVFLLLLCSFSNLKNIRLLDEHNTPSETYSSCVGYVSIDYQYNNKKLFEYALNTLKRNWSTMECCYV